MVDLVGFCTYVSEIYRPDRISPLDSFLHSPSITSVTLQLLS